MRLNKHIFLNSLLISMFAFPFAVSASDFSNKLLAPNALQPTSGVSDISDRNYYAKVKQLINFSRTHIDAALELVSVGDLHYDPVKQLISDLVDATKRDVTVRVFLNTSTASSLDGSIFLRSDVLEMMKRHRIEVHFVNPNYELRDRLIIIDKKIVIEGGPPWTHQSLELGLGSATLIYSEDLAYSKRKRLDMLPLWDVMVQKDDRKGQRISVPVFLLKEVRYFPDMANVDDGDAMKIFLALLRKFYESQDLQINTSLSDLSQEIPADRIYEKGSVEYQVLKTLQRLEADYTLIKIEKELPNDMMIRLLFPKEIRPVVAVDKDFFEENYAKDLSPRAIYAYLVIAHHLQISGDSPVWLGTEKNVENDFPLKSYDFRLGVAELRNLNLIEVFPFSLSQGKVVTMPSERERRYVLNPIATLSEKLQIWDRFRDEFNDDSFRKARELAEIFGESEDPRVIRVFMELMDQYNLEHIHTFTQHVAQLPPQSTAAQLDYLSSLLEHEIQENVQLATY